MNKFIVADGQSLTIGGELYVGGMELPKGHDYAASVKLGKVMVVEEKQHVRLTAEDIANEKRPHTKHRQGRKEATKDTKGSRRNTS